MEVASKDLGNGKIELDITADASEVDDAFVRGLAIMLDQVGIPANPESTPYEALCKVFGSQERIDDAVKGAVVNYLLPFALDKTNTILVIAPEFDEKNIAVPEQGKPFNFKTVCTPKPSFELSSYEPVTIIVPKAEGVTEADLDDQIRLMGEQASTTRTDIMTGEQKAEAATIDDAWVNANIPDPNVNTVEELRARLRTAGETYKADEHENAKMSAAVAEMSKYFDAQIPADMIASTKRSFIADYQAQVAAQGGDFDTFLKQQNATMEQFEHDMEVRAEAMLKQGFTLDAVYRHAGLSIDDSDIRQAIESMGTPDVDAAIEQLRQSGRLFAVNEQAERLKAAKYILENATVRELEEA